MRAHIDVETTISVVARRDPARVSIRVGPVYVTMNIDEALRLATDIADAIATLGAAYLQDRQ